MLIRDTGRFAQDNGIIEVADGYKVHFQYRDPVSDPSASSGAANVICAPTLRASRVDMRGPNRAFIVSGGCDNDESLDADENLLLTINFEHFGTEILENVVASLVCTNPPGVTEDPCSVVHILDSPKQLGRLLGSRNRDITKGQAPSFQILVDPAVAGLDFANRQVDLTLLVEAANRDTAYGEDLFAAPHHSLTKRYSLHSDLEIFHYSTDYPDGTGGLAVVRDLNRDGSISPVLNPRTSALGVGQIDLRTGETAVGELLQEIQAFDDLFSTGTNIRDTVKDGMRGGIEPADEPGEDIFDPPFDFDSLDETVAGVDVNANEVLDEASDEGFVPIRSPGSISGLDQQWRFSQTGECGFQSQQTDAQGTRAGVWKVANADIPAFDGDTDACPDYALPGGPRGRNIEFLLDVLRSPRIHRVQPPQDARGFDFTARLTRFGWNENIQLANSYAYAYTIIDTDVDFRSTVQDNLFGPSVSYTFGPIDSESQGFQLQRTFGPVFDADGSAFLDNNPNLKAPTGGSNPDRAINADDSGFAEPLTQARRVPNLDVMAWPAEDSEPGVCEGTAVPCFTKFDCRDEGGGPTVVECINTFTMAAQDASTPAGPVRSQEGHQRQTDPPRLPNYADFNGPIGQTFQLYFKWWVGEADEINDVVDYGWAIDDVVFEWEESHPAPQGSDADTSCASIGQTEDANGNGELDCGADGICGTGDAGDEDCGLDGICGNGLRGSQSAHSIRSAGEQHPAAGGARHTGNVQGEGPHLNYVQVRG